MHWAFLLYSPFPPPHSPGIYRLLLQVYDFYLLSLWRFVSLCSPNMLPHRGSSPHQGFLLYWRVFTLLYKTSWGYLMWITVPYKQLKNTNWNLSVTVTLPFPLSVGSQIWVFSKTCKKFSICVRHFFPLVIKIKQKNDRAKAHVSRLIFNCNLSVRLRFMELQSCDKTYLL